MTTVNRFGKSFPAVVTLSMVLFGISAAHALETRLTSQGPTRIVFVDSAVSEVELLLLKRPNYRVVWVEKSDNPLQVLKEALENHKPVSAVDIVAHTVSGSVLLGGHWFDGDNLLKNIESLETIQNILGKSARINIYSFDSNRSIGTSAVR